MTDTKLDEALAESSKIRTWYMDTEILESALDRCDLGDGCKAIVRMYPHKDYIHNYTKVISFDDYNKLLEQAEMMAEVVEAYCYEASVSVIEEEKKARCREALTAFNKFKSEGK